MIKPFQIRKLNIWFQDRVSKLLLPDFYSDIQREVFEVQRKEKIQNQFEYMSKFWEYYKNKDYKLLDTKKNKGILSKHPSFTHYTKEGNDLDYAHLFANVYRYFYPGAVILYIGAVIEGRINWGNFIYFNKYVGYFLNLRSLLGPFPNPESFLNNVPNVEGMYLLDEDFNIVKSDYKNYPLIAKYNL